MGSTGGSPVFRKEDTGEPPVLRHSNVHFQADPLPGTGDGVVRRTRRARPFAIRLQRLRMGRAVFSRRAKPDTVAPLSAGTHSGKAVSWRICTCSRPRGSGRRGFTRGSRRKQTPDVGLLLCDVPATAAAVFTTNKVFAAPVKVGREHIAGGKLRGVVVNAGNANACTGRQGERDARRMCQLAASWPACDAGQILPSSHGHHRPPDADGESRARHPRGRRRTWATSAEHAAAVRRRDPDHRPEAQGGRASSSRSAGRRSRSPACARGAA